MKKFSFFFSLFALLAALAPMHASAQIALPSRPVLPTATLSLPPGLYVQVIDGLINVSNKGGSSSFAAGQFGYTPSPIQPPIIVPKNPGLLFTLPAAFSALSANMATTSGTPKSNTVDCEVR